MEHTHAVSARNLPVGLPAEMLLSAIVESSDDAIFSKSLDGIVTSWNRGAERIFGYPAAEAIGMPGLALVPQELRPEEAELMARLQRGERIEHYESTRCRRDGTPVPVSLTLSALRRESGELIGASVIARDVSAQQQSVAALAWLAAIVESSNDAIISKNLQGIITSWNQSAQRLFGYLPSEIIGRSVLTLIPPDLQHEEPVILAKLQRGERIEHFETSRVRKDGTRIEVSLTISPIKAPDGRVIGASKIVRDITAQRAADRASRLLAAIVDSSDDAIISKNLDGIVTSWNRGAERVFGYTAEEMIGRPICTLFPPERLDEEPTIIERLKRGERVDHFQTLRLRKSGESFPVSITISPIYDADGRIVGASKVARDITKEMQAVAQLELANEELKRADRMKSEFVAMMSHELRTPLNSIIGFASVLRHGRSGPVNDEQRRQLDLIHTSGKHLLHLINDLLDLSRIEAGRMELEPETFDLNELIEEAVRSLELNARQKGLVLGCAMTDRLTLHSDRKRLFQVVLNLLNNAIKFTPRGRVDLKVTRDGEVAVIAVADTGIGIPKDKQSELFQPFTQVERLARRRYEGTGLGLYLCRKIAGLLGGDVTLQSEPQKGSVFTVRVPIDVRPPAGLPRRDEEAALA